MPTLKDITELPLAESTEGVNLIVNDNGVAKQASLDSIRIEQEYDLILEYHGQIHYSCVPEAYEVGVYPKENVKKVIEKVNQGISAKVLFRHRAYGGIPSYCIETPMQITVYGNSMHCFALILYDEEGFVCQLVNIYLNEDGTCGSISIDHFR